MSPEIFIKEWPYSKIKEGMKEFAPEALTEVQVKNLLPMWKDYHEILQKIKGNVCVSRLLKWIKAGIEYKLKRELYNSAEVRQQELVRSKSRLTDTIMKANEEIQELENRVGNYKADLAYSSILPVNQYYYYITIGRREKAI